MTDPNHKSQHNIEAYIHKFIKSPGFFCEIGAWDSSIISQTIRLEQDYGWTGICVDPFPREFEKRTCKLCSKAISKDGRIRDFIHVTTDKRDNGDVSYFSGFKDSVKANLPLIEDHCDYTESLIETITIQQLWDQYDLPDYVDFLSIDTEGSELEIFQTIDFSKLSFGLIVFEHNEDAYAKNEIGKILTKSGYVLHDELRVDDIYLNAKLV